MAIRNQLHKTVLLGTILFSGAGQASNSGVVNVPDASVNQISLYTDRALMTQTFEVNPNSEGDFKISGMPEQWLRQSLQIHYTVNDQQFFPVSTFWRNDGLSRSMLYRTMVGKSVELIGGGLNVAVQGIMLTYQDGFALVQGNNGRQYVVDWHDPQGFRIVAREELLEKQDYQSFLLSSFDSAATGGTLDVSYITPQLSYQSSYRMTVNDQQMADFDLAVLLVNHSETDFNHTNIQLVASDFPGHGYSGRPLMARQGVNMEAAAPSERVGEAMVIPLPDVTTLPATTSRQISLYQERAIKLTSEYRLAFYGRSYNGREVVMERPQHFYRFKAGQDLPAGKIDIVQKTAAGKPLISGESYMARIAKGEEVEIATGDAFAVSVKRERLSQRQTSDSLLSRWKIVINNDKKEAITLQLSDRDYGIRGIEDIEGAVNVNSNTVEVSIPAASTKEVLFTSVYNK